MKDLKGLRALWLTLEEESLGESRLMLNCCRELRSCQYTPENSHTALSTCEAGAAGGGRLDSCVVAHPSTPEGLEANPRQVLGSCPSSAVGSGAHHGIRRTLRNALSVVLGQGGDTALQRAQR